MAELQVSGVDVTALRDELAQWLESGRRLLSTFERLSITSGDPTPTAAAVRSPKEMTPELEARFARLEAEVAKVRAADGRES